MIKRSVCLVLLVLPFCLHAQFLGGNGRGDIGSPHQITPLASSTFNGGVGRGDASATYQFTPIASSIYGGGVGRGDAGATYQITPSASSIYSGGTGRGDAANVYQSSPLLSSIYRGGIGRGEAASAFHPSPLLNSIFSGGIGRGDVAVLHNLNNCTVGDPCDDGDANTSNDVFDANCVCAGTPLPNAWVQRADLGAGVRAQPFAFTVNGMGYVGGGFLDPITIAGDLWAYDPTSDSWAQVANFGGGENAASATFVLDGKGYVVGGMNNGGEMNELWAYDPVLNNWAAHPSLPASGRRRPIAFALNGKGYAGTGLTGSDVLDDFWMYDPILDSWSARASAPAPARWFASSFTVDGIGYVCGGVDASFNDLADLQAYDPITNTWVARAPFPGPLRRAAAGFSIGHAGYVACGLSTVVRYNDCFQYQPSSNQWAEVTAPGPQARSSAAAFTIDDNAYLVGGFVGDQLLTADMRMYTQNAQPDCNGVISGPAVAGSACDDFNSATTGDALNGLCQCAGICINDADSDGICDENDGCPTTPGYEGLPCDDGDPCTTGDAINGLCQCAGTYTDSDNDAICDALDNCPTLAGQQGDTCDDLDANTTNDVITSACACAGTSVGSDGWAQQADFSGFPRESAVAFTIGSYGYMGTGQDGTTFFQDLWRYDAANDSWAQMADIDVTGRTGAYAFAIGDYAYVGDGIDQNALYIGDLRRYEASTNSWTWLWSGGASGYPGRYRGVAFSANGKGYVGTGQTEFGNVQDFHEFDPTTNGWTQRADVPGSARANATAFAIGDTGYVGTGASGPGVMLNDLYAFDAVSLTWSQRSNFGGTARGSAVGFALAGKGYIGSGQDASGTLQDFWEYHPANDSWVERAPLPGPQRLAAVAFAVNDHAYVSTGGNTNGVLGDVWEYVPDGVTCTIGEACDDGLAYTQNDALNTSCLCTGTCINDYDSDGNCDEVDDCPFLALAVGSPCDDFNPCTENDVVQPWCGCYGTPLPDSDNDGICDVQDACPNEAPGAGDVFATAVDITVSTGAIGNTTCFSNAYTTTSTPGDANAIDGNDVFYSFTTSPCAQAVDLEFCGAGFFHLLDASGSMIALSGPATLPQCEPDYAASNALLGWTVLPNTTYYIVVEIFDNAPTSDFLISATEHGAADDADNDGICDAQDACPNEAPGAGDVFATAIGIAQDGVAFGNTTCFSNAYTTTSTPGDATAIDGNDMFYSFTTGPCTQALDVVVCGVGLFHLLDASGTAVALSEPATLAQCDLYPASNALMGWTVLPNTLYYIVVETFDSAPTNDFAINVAEYGADSDNDGICDVQDACPNEAPGAGDVFATAIGIAQDGVAFGNTTCFSNAYTTTSTPGDANAIDGNDVFYSFTTSPCAQAVDLEFCGAGFFHLLDASGAMIALSGPATLPQCEPDYAASNALLGWTVLPNTLYYIVVETFDSAPTNDFAINVAEYGADADSDNDGICDVQDACPNEAPGAGDVFATAVDITVSTGAIGNTTCFSNAYTTTSTPGDANAIDGNDVFYSFTTSPCAQAVDLEFCGAGFFHLLDASGAMIALSGPATLPQCEPDYAASNALLGWTVLPNTTYYIVVEIFDNAPTNDFLISVAEHGAADDADNDGICDAQDACPTEAPGAGDVFATAVPLTLPGGAISSTMCFSNAYTSSSTPGDASATDGNDVFYSFTTGACDQAVSISLCGAEFFHLLDSTGTSIATGQPGALFGCDPVEFPLSSSLTSIAVQPGSTYYVVVEAASGYMDFVLNLGQGETADSDNDGICNAQDNCPNVSGVQGSVCNDGNANTTNDVLTASCTCAGTLVVTCTNNLALEFQVDNNPGQTTWQIRQQGSGVVVQSGGPLIAGNSLQTVSTCVPDGCYYLRVLDSGGDGLTSGGYILRTGTSVPNTQDQRIIDNRYNFGTGGVSAIAANEGFCLPLGTTSGIYTTCDKLDWLATGEYFECSPVPAVSAVWNAGNTPAEATSGYEFWFYNPNGGYSFRKFRAHNVSDGFSPDNAGRACHIKINNWAGANQITSNVLMNVRVRTRVNGTNGNWGAACRFKIDPMRAACPLTKLMDLPGNQYYSCNVDRAWGAGNYVHARPVSGATQYQFRFRFPTEGFVVVRTVSTYFVQLNWITGPLVNGKTYQVEVRAFKNGAWCIDTPTPSPAFVPWGDVCTVTINDAAASGGDQNMADDPQEPRAQFVLYPNPNQGQQLFLRMGLLEGGLEKLSVDIYDTFGKRVSARTIPVSASAANTVLELNLGSGPGQALATGMYLVNITTGNKTYTERLMITQ